MIPRELETAAEWLARSGRSVQEEERGFSSSDEEVTLRVEHDGDTWVVRKTWRDQDRGMVFTAETGEDVDRYLTLLSANDVRRREGLPLLRHGIVTGPDGIAQPFGGLRLSGDLDRGFELTDEAGRSWRFASDVEAARFSRYIALSVSELRSKILTPSRDIGV